MTGLELGGIDGANPLGFLAALGVLATLEDEGATGAALGWRRARTWVPVIRSDSIADERQLCEALVPALRGRPVDDRAEESRKEAERAFTKAKTLAGAKRKELMKRRLPGAEREAAWQAELRPLEEERDRKREIWLRALARAVPSPELALGKRPDCTREEFREHAGSFLASADVAKRRAVDLLAAFGSDACTADRSDAIEPTPFCFIRGSGQQWFLDTARQLMGQVTTARLRRTLFSPWTYADDRLSMRWDPAEDRQYALRDTDPADQPARTDWAANLLAYRALALFPSAPTRHGLGTTGWSRGNAGGDEETVFTWPIWEPPLSADTVRSCLQFAELRASRPDTARLRGLRIAAVYRARRVKVGSGSNIKLNFSPARAM